MITLKDLIQKAQNKEIREAILEVYTKMQPSVHFSMDFYRRVLLDMTNDFVSFRTLLGAYAQFTNPAYYLEVGTRRGHSACVVAKCSPKTKIFCFDIFTPDYGGERNDQKLAESELAKFNCSATFFTEDSKKAIPTFFQNNNLLIDAILIDGDHSAQGALADLKNVIEHISVGGLLILDDLNEGTLHPTWLNFISTHPNFEHVENTKHEFGWGAALRIS